MDWRARESKWQERWRGQESRRSLAEILDREESARAAQDPGRDSGAPEQRGAPAPETHPSEGADSGEPASAGGGGGAAGGTGCDEAEDRSPSTRASERARERRGGGRRTFYCLDMFPYPSPDGFSVHQLRGIVVTDVAARFQQLRGRRVYRPMGWDSFGLGIEQESTRSGVPPQEVVERGVQLMREQLRRFGARIDWGGEVKTSDPSFYRWTQWLFLQLRERGVAYRDIVPMKWCPRCGMNLANEEVVDGSCVHCEEQVADREIPQWKLRISRYAERLHQGLRHLKWPQRVKAMQRHWIGRQEGYCLRLKVVSELRSDSGELRVFVKDLEHIRSATYVLVAPEHEVIDRFCDDLFREEVLEYRMRVARMTERERRAARGQAHGMPTGIMVIHPVTMHRMPVWVSEGVLPDIHFGSILGTPAVDERHAEFARALCLPTRVVAGRRRGSYKRRKGGGDRRRSDGAGLRGDGRPRAGADGSSDSARQLRSMLESRDAISTHTGYRLRDWIFARQRYWGEPIPVVFCSCEENRGALSIPEEDLPVVLPLLARAPQAPAPPPSPKPVTEEESFLPVESPAPAPAETWDEFHDAEPAGAADIAEPPLDPSVTSPLQAVESFRTAECPACGQVVQRELDTMPQWAASCWYYLRYLDPGSADRLADPMRLRRWLPVDLYVGGIEHAILHLLYARFFAHFLHDAGLMEREEPFRRLFNQGRIYNRKPSRSRRRVISHRGDRLPAESYLQAYGGDALRLHLLFIGPPAADVVWSEGGLRGARRFLDRALRFVVDRKERGRFVSRKVLVEKHRLIRSVTRSIRSFKLNNAVSAFMRFVKVLTRPPLTPEEVDLATLRTFAVLLAPFAPHLAAELWEILEGDGSVFDQSWPQYSRELLRPVSVEIALFVDERIVDRLEVEDEPPRAELVKLAAARPRVAELLGAGGAERVVVVPGRLVKFVRAHANGATSGETGTGGAASPGSGGPPPAPSSSAIPSIEGAPTAGPTGVEPPPSGESATRAPTSDTKSPPVVPPVIAPPRQER